MFINSETGSGWPLVHKSTTQICAKSMGVCTTVVYYIHSSTTQICAKSMGYVLYTIIVPHKFVLNLWGYVLYVHIKHKASSKHTISDQPCLKCSIYTF